MMQMGAMEASSTAFDTALRVVPKEDRILGRRPAFVSRLAP